LLIEKYFGEFFMLKIKTKRPQKEVFGRIIF